jgi:SAM-dependent methyltransferase
VGCGPGTLGRHVLEGGTARYVGIDISAEALARARAVLPAGTPLVRASVDDPVAPEVRALGPFGAIVFSEVLYYLESPWETVGRYAEILSPEGHLVFSLWDPSRHLVLRMRLARRFRTVASVAAQGESGKPWILLVARPR